jgi:hypothetical protein
LGTFLIFFMIFLMGFLWWLGLAYDRIFCSLRECSRIKGELISASGKPGAIGEADRLARDLEEATREANREIRDTVSGRIMAKLFGFSPVEQAGRYANFSDLARGEERCTGSFCTSILDRGLSGTMWSLKSSQGST